MIPIERQRWTGEASTALEEAVRFRRLFGSVWQAKHLTFDTFTCGASGSPSKLAKWLAVRTVFKPIETHSSLKQFYRGIFRATHSISVPARSLKMSFSEALGDTQVSRRDDVQCIHLTVTTGTTGRRWCQWARAVVLLFVLVLRWQRLVLAGLQPPARSSPKFLRSGSTIRASYTRQGTKKHQQKDVDS